MLRCHPRPAAQRAKGGKKEKGQNIRTQESEVLVFGCSCTFKVSFERGGSEKLFSGQRSCVPTTECLSCWHHFLVLGSKAFLGPIGGARASGTGGTAPN
eukprot:scaffold279118_cov25-Tisochrysis_lutea.AAC.1